VIHYLRGDLLVSTGHPVTDGSHNMSSDEELSPAPLSEIEKISPTRGKAQKKAPTTPRGRWRS
jgi:hypothetical protein